MLLGLVLSVVGLAVLAVAAGQFVRGAARLAVVLRLTPVVVGAIVVGFGTSLPEMLVSGVAAANGRLDIGVGNIVGSNVANISLVLGAASFVAVVPVAAGIIRKDAAISVAAVAVFALLVQGDLHRWEGAALLAALGAWFVVVLRGAHTDSDGADLDDLSELVGEHPPSVGLESARTIVSLALVAGSAYVLVEGAERIAEALNLSGGFVGYTLVAVGTSAPELVTAVVAARQRETELLVGNLLGSNVFNSLAVGGVISLAGPGPVGDVAVQGLRVRVDGGDLPGQLDRNGGRPASEPHRRGPSRGPLGSERRAAGRVMRRRAVAIAAVAVVVAAAAVVATLTIGDEHAASTNNATLESEHPVRDDDGADDRGSQRTATSELPADASPPSVTESASADEDGRSEPPSSSAVESSIIEPPSSSAVESSEVEPTGAVASTTVAPVGADSTADVSVFPAVGTSAEAASWTVEIIDRFPHDPGAFTQGLEIVDGTIYESTGLWGQSSLRTADLSTGEVVALVDLADDLFGEGLTVAGDHVVQLTWRSGTAIVYDRRTLAEVGRHSYEGEGWGLCLMGDELIMSDGSDRLARRDPVTFELLETVVVTAEGYDGRLDYLNELECVDGLVIANVWQTERLLVIDPASGRVMAVIDAGTLVDTARASGLEIGVLNGVAAAGDGTLLMTGKLWPMLYRVRIVEDS